MKPVDPSSAEALEALLTSARQEYRSAPACLIGECVDDRHPVLCGRVLVRWCESATEQQRWFATLQDLPIRRGDRVLLVRPHNTQDFIVTGVVDGFARRPERPRRTAARLELKRDEALLVADAHGRELIEIRRGDQGLSIKLLHDDLEIEAPGALAFRAKQLRLEATQGQVEIDATDDVVVRGEVIRLN